MSSTLDRLRRLHGLRPQPHTEPDLPEPISHTAPPKSRRLDTLVPGAELETEHGPCYVVTARYPLETMRGQRCIEELLARTPQTLAPLYPSSALDDATDFSRIAFIDTETTGLGGGAGVYAFMVGVGIFEEGKRQFSKGKNGEDEDSAQFATRNSQFVIRQFFMRHPGEELALLTALAELLGDRIGLVTFNGRSFDVPLLRGRYKLNRHYLNVDAPYALWNDAAPHLDLLHPARRLWKGRLPSCALSALERAILAHERSGEDVPGSLIPMLYQQFLINGDARTMRQVFYHNLEDILSMTFLAERICRHFADPLDEGEDAELYGADLLALGQVHEQMGRSEQAERALRRSLSLLEPAARAEVFCTLGRLLKRQERWSEAAEIWQEWITTIPGPDVRPYEELAKYCEWQIIDLEQALMWTGWALHNQQNASSWQRSRQNIDALTHRLERLKAKLAGQGDHMPET
ncbi:MAG: ribonuclease H-like domain-containing protein [Caldilineaceae bacterium]|nr:ribonuclease H-like domain-containing protein [Caldilineaceae bacterium]